MPDGYEHCVLCPRACKVNRTRGERGYCGETAVLRAASASLHFGEEPPLLGGKSTAGGGSGTIFISGCNLRCAFCQNYQISSGGNGGGGGRDGFTGTTGTTGKEKTPPLGRELNPAEFASLCLELQRLGAANVNIVTGSHAVPAIAAGLKAAAAQGLSVPVLWNSSAYETEAALSLLHDSPNRLVDIYLPDLKTLDRALSARYFGAADYGETAVRAIRFMLEKAPLAWRGAPFESALTGGVIVRHLMLPAEIESTRAVLRWFSENARGRALLSLMTQYTPVGKDTPRRCVNQTEYEAALALLSEFGIDDGFIQELAPDDTWLPDFEKENPFQAELSLPVWHWKTGYVPNSR